jgi:phage terminase Nu1 subunit (DNA packaging protein)
MTKTELAAACNISLPTISAWISKGCPHTRDARGQYRFELKRVTQWRAQAMPTRALLSPSYSHARARKETALAGLRELQLRQRQGELVEKEAVTKQEFATGRRVRDNLENIPARVSGPCVGKDQREIFEIMAREIRQCLEGLTHEDDPNEDTHTYTPATPR